MRVKRPLVVSLGFLVAASGVHFMTRLPDLARKTVESRLSCLLGERVSVRHIRPVVFPAMGIKIQGIRPKKGSRMGLSSLDEIYVQVRPGNLKGPLFSVSMVNLSHPRIHWQALRSLLGGGMTARIKGNPGHSRAHPFEVRVGGMTVLKGGLSYGPYDAVIEFAQGGVLRGIKVRSADGKAAMKADFRDERVSLRFQGGKVPPFPSFKPFPEWLSMEGRMKRGALSISALKAGMLGGTIRGSGYFRWGPKMGIRCDLRIQGLDARRLLGQFSNALSLWGTFDGDLHVELVPARARNPWRGLSVLGRVQAREGSLGMEGWGGRRLSFGSVELRGWLRDGHLALEDVKASIYGGKLRGWARICWSMGWQIEGSMVAGSISMGSLLRDMGSDVITGQLSGRWRFHASGEDGGSIWRHLNVDGPFYVRNGNIRALDLGSVSAKLAITRRGKGAAGTPFESLRGNLILDGGVIRLEGAHLRSPLLDAKGDLTVHEDRSLNGDLEVGIHKASTVMSLPIEVQGTIYDPKLIPAGEVVAGGVVGTAIAGPGVGTAIGLKAGHLIWRLKKALRGDVRASARALPHTFPEENSVELSGR